MIAPYFLPRRRVGAYRPYKFAIHLNEFGWTPTIVTIRESNERFTKKELKLLKDIEVIKLTPLFDFTSLSGSQLNKESKAGNLKSNFNKHILKPVRDLVDRNFPVDTWLPFFYSLKNKFEKIVREKRPDVIWATGDPWSGLWIGKLLSQKYDLPFVADFRDPWTLCPVRNRNRSSLIMKLDRRFEQKVLQRADAVVFTANNTAVEYKSYYSRLLPDTHTIHNSFDRELYEDPVGRIENGEEFPEFESKKLRVVFFGKFRALSPAKPVIEILAEMKKLHPRQLYRLRVHSFGPLNEEDTINAENHGVFDNFVTEIPVPPEKSLRELRKADLLLLSTDIKRDGIIPAKFWDYLVTGRPILSIAPNKEISDILTKTGTGIQFSPENRAEIAGLLAKSVEAKHKGDALPIPFSYNEKKIMEFEIHEATGQLARLFDKLI